MRADMQIAVRTRQSGVQYANDMYGMVEWTRVVSTMLCNWCMWATW